MLHPDGQYEPTLIPTMIEPIIRGEADLVLGSRLLDPGAAIAGGMPRWKYVANRSLTMVENAVLRTDLSEFHTGYRAYSRDALMRIPFLRNAIGSRLTPRSSSRPSTSASGSGRCPRARSMTRTHRRSARSVDRLRAEDRHDARQAPPAPQRHRQEP